MNSVLEWFEVGYALVASVIYYGFKVIKSIVTENAGFIEFLGLVLLALLAVEIASKRSIWVKTCRDLVYEFFGGIFRFLGLLFHVSKF